VDCQPVSQAGQDGHLHAGRSGRPPAGRKEDRESVTRSRTETRVEQEKDLQVPTYISSPCPTPPLFLRSARRCWAFPFRRCRAGASLRRGKPPWPSTPPQMPPGPCLRRFRAIRAAYLRRGKGHLRRGKRPLRRTPFCRSNPLGSCRRWRTDRRGNRCHRAVTARLVQPSDLSAPLRSGRPRTTPWAPFEPRRASLGSASPIDVCVADAPSRRPGADGTKQARVHSAQARRTRKRCERVSLESPMSVVAPRADLDRAKRWRPHRGVGEPSEATCALCP